MPTLLCRCGLLERGWAGQPAGQCSAVYGRCRVVLQVDLMVEPAQQARVHHYLSYTGIDWEVLLADLQTEIDKENDVDLFNIYGRVQ